MIIQSQTKTISLIFSANRELEIFDASTAPAWGGLQAARRGCQALLRLQRLDRRAELDPRLRRVPHAFEMRLKLLLRRRVADHDEVVVLRVVGAVKLAAPAPQSLPVDRVSLQVHERPAALDPHVVRQVAELDEPLLFARIEDDPDNDAAVFSIFQRADDDRVGEGVGSGPPVQRRRRRTAEARSRRGRSPYCGSRFIDATICTGEKPKVQWTTG